LRRLVVPRGGHPDVPLRTAYSRAVRSKYEGRSSRCTGSPRALHDWQRSHCGALLFSANDRPDSGCATRQANGHPRHVLETGVRGAVDSLPSLRHRDACGLLPSEQETPEDSPGRCQFKAVIDCVVKIVNIAGWLLSFALMATVVFSLRGYFSGTYLDLGYRVVYSALSKPAWGLALSWIIISCYYGHGGILNSFMSWSGWIPLGRLSYSAYLIHWMVVVYYSGMPQAGWLYTSFPEMLIEFSIPVIVMTFFFSIFWSSGLEISFSRVEDILVKCFMRTPTVKPMNGGAQLDVWQEATKEKLPLDTANGFRTEVQNGTKDVTEGIKL
ncbi:Protein OAC-39, partial [Aphelenchoides avenae]